ncbi:MAG TPA: hypothetical protein VHR45_01765 [Thermoanaerobaculia bacterium]|nr:hypothetical protein [Thermoanaerobaculia bacterium]
MPRGGEVRIGGERRRHRGLFAGRTGGQETGERQSGVAPQQPARYRRATLLHRGQEAVGQRPDGLLILDVPLELGPARET